MEDIDTLLAKKMAGEATDMDKRVIDQWLKADPKNAKYLADFEWIWKNVPQRQVSDTRPVDTEAALQAIKTKMHTPPARTILMQYWAAAMAAAIALLFVAIWFFRTSPGQVLEIVNTNPQTLTDTLTDGTFVTLNSNSGLVIDKNFNQRERRMKLRGEGYFKVISNPERPFIVEVNELEVKVVGTAFNIAEANGNNTVLVTVMEGKVQLKSSTQTVYLVAGEAASYEKLSGNITRQTQPDPNVLAYQNRRLLFEATPLYLVIERLNKMYAVSIQLKNPALKNCLLSARYNNDSLDRIVELIAETFNFTVEKVGNSILLDGKGCGE